MANQMKRNVSGRPKRGQKIYSVFVATPGAWGKGLLIRHLLGPAAEVQLGVVRVTGNVFAVNIGGK